jgi:hypothetical protein
MFALSTHVSDSCYFCQRENIDLHSDDSQCSHSINCGLRVERGFIVVWGIQCLWNQIPLLNHIRTRYLRFTAGGRPLYYVIGAAYSIINA